jgi:hypothetical protein
MTLNPKLHLDASDIPGAIRDMVTARTGITAFAGGGQADATVLGAAFNRVTTVATAADSVKLPAARAGASLVVTNAGAESMNVFPATGQSINALSANAAFAMAAGVTRMFVCSVAGVWNTI